MVVVIPNGCNVPRGTIKDDQLSKISKMLTIARSELLLDLDLD